jgi:hypothetical protein
MTAEFARKKQVIIQAGTGTALTLTKAQSGSLVTNLGATGTVTITLPADMEVNDYFEFAVGAAFTFRVVQGQATEAFVINGAIQTAGKYIDADDEAEYIRVTKVSSVALMCSPTIGTWTVQS